MLTITVDTLVLIIIVSFLANRNLSEKAWRFPLVALATSWIGLGVLFWGLDLWVTIGIYFSIIFASLWLILRISWPRSLMASVLFMGYKFVLLPAINSG